MNIRKSLVIGVVIVALLVGFSGGVFYGKTQALPASISTLINKANGQPQNVDFSEFWNVWNTLHSDYVGKDSLDNTKLLYGAISGMVGSLGDPYTVFFPPKQSQQFSQEINGSFGGIGIEIGLRNNALMVIAPIKDTPADRAGLQAGDVILKIGDKSTDGMALDEAVGLIQGPKGTPVSLTYYRKGVTTQDGKQISIIRDTIKVPAVNLTMLDNGQTAYIQLYIFNQNIDDEFDKAADQIVHSGAKRIILDVRDNPGGLLDSAVHIASYFLDPNSVVVSEKDGNTQQTVYHSQTNGKLKNYPMVVLINKGSASASEILSGALKDDRNITIIGETSFGKGSVQEVKNLSDGSSLKITVAKWFTPNGTSINDQGITPDVPVSLSQDDINAGRDPQLDKAKQLVNNLK